MALGEWSYHHGYLGHEVLFCIVLLCILITSSYYLLLLLGPYYFCPLLCPFCMECLLEIFNFLDEISSLSHSIVFLYFFCTVNLGKLSYLSLLFFGTLHSRGYIFPFLLSLLAVFFLDTGKASSDNHFAFLHFFFLGMVLITTSCTMLWTSVRSSSGTLSIRSNHLESIHHLHSIIILDLT